MVVTSLLHGAPQLKLEARGELKGVNPLWDFDLLIIFSEKSIKKLFLPDCPLNYPVGSPGLSTDDIPISQK